jgi:hypothetical protein
MLRLIIHHIQNIDYNIQYYKSCFKFFSYKSNLNKIYAIFNKKNKNNGQI